jgi:pyruvate dehydrogenase E1 component alpha subunit
MDRARSGGGPTLIEGLTYRIEAHTNSDDPTRYRKAADVDLWRSRDPIERLEKYLLAQGALTEQIRTDIVAAAEQLASTTRDCMTEQAVIDPLELFEHVYSTPRAALAEQRAFLAAELDVDAAASAASAASAALSSASSEESTR